MFRPCLCQSRVCERSVVFAMVVSSESGAGDVGVGDLLDMSVFVGVAYYVGAICWGTGLASVSHVANRN